MKREVVAELARKGGRAAHASGRAHQFTSEQAREAGRKGGLVRHARATTERLDASLRISTVALDDADLTCSG